jgi:hypothetical protein
MNKTTANPLRPGGVSNFNSKKAKSAVRKSTPNFKIALTASSPSMKPKE